MFLPESMKLLRRHEAGTRWLNRLPLVLDELAERWSPRPGGEPFSGGNLACVAPVSRGGARFVSFSKHTDDNFDNIRKLGFSLRFHF